MIYLDGVMGLNFLVDWLLLLGVNRMSGFPPGMGRTAAAAAVGGSYAGMCLVPGFHFLTSGLWRAVSLGVMSVTAFGLDRSAVRRGVLFVVLSMALGGLALSMGSGHTGELLLCAGVLVLLCRLGFRGKTGQHRMEEVWITLGEKQIRFHALVDTGNTLRDPLTGESVLVVDADVAMELAGLTRQELEDPASTMACRRGEGFRLIPYQTVGQQGALLLGLRCSRVRIGSRQGGTLVAFAPVKFGDGEYQGLTGG